MKYYQFILERLIFESKIDFLPNLEEILKMGKSQIAKDLLSIMGTDIEGNISILGIAEEEDMVSFMSNDTSRILYKIINSAKLVYPSTIPNVCKKYDIPTSNTGYPTLGWFGIINKYLKKEEINNLDSSTMPNHYSTEDIYYLTLTHYKKGDEITPLPEHLGKSFLILESGIEKTEEIISPSSYQKVRIGRIVRRILQSIDKKYNDKEIEEFVNEFKSNKEISKDAFRNFKSVSGEEIKIWYLQSKYSSVGNSTLQNSCMRYPECQTYFKIYTKNPKVCSLLILLDSSNPLILSGRALVWKLMDGRTYMDRPYYSKESEKNLFRSYADKMGWIYDTERSIINGISIQLSEWEFKHYPYMDTFKHLDPSSGIASSDGDEEEGYYLESTDGGNGQYCSTCNGEHTIACRECDGDGVIDCSECDGEGSIDIDGEESKECEECNGGGNMECPVCNGDCSEDCPECS